MKVELIQSCGTDLSVVNAARVSMDKESSYPDGGVATSEDDPNWLGDYYEDTYTDYPVPVIKDLSDKDKKLIRYLYEHGHHSPFNHAFLTFRVKAPIFVARQLVKHKFMPWNEVSRRYVDSEPEFYEPDQWRQRADNVKQGSSEDTISDGDLIDHLENVYDLTYGAVTGISEINRLARGAYDDMLAAGVCPEQARMVLPQSMMTEWYWSGTLGAFLDMLKLRLDPHTQKETREVAELIAVEVKKLFPVSYETVIEGDK